MLRSYNPISDFRNRRRTSATLTHRSNVTSYLLGRLVTETDLRSQLHRSITAILVHLNDREIFECFGVILHPGSRLFWIQAFKDQETIKFRFIQYIKIETHFIKTTKSRGRSEIILASLELVTDYSAYTSVL